MSIGAKHSPNKGKKGYWEAYENRGCHALRSCDILLLTKPMKTSVLPFNLLNSRSATTIFDFLDFHGAHGTTWLAGSFFSAIMRRTVPLRKPPSKQRQCFMIFTKCPISRLFVTSCRLKNGSKMNFATEP
jgi:hypothetical protein